MAALVDNKQVTIKSEGGSDGGNDLTEQPGECGVSGRSNIKFPTAVFLASASGPKPAGQKSRVTSSPHT